MPSKPFVPRFGVEYSFVHKTDEDFDYSPIAAQLRKADKDFSRAYEDGTCSSVLEVPSPPHRTLDEAKAFYDKLMPHIKKLPLTARRIDREPDGTETYYGTGGGHIHIEMPPPGVRRNMLMYNLIAMVANRPWMGWVFNEYMDDINAKALIGNPPVEEFMNGNYALSVPISRWAIRDQSTRDPYETGLRALCGGKDWAIRFKHWNKRTMTVEFRFFDAPRSWGQSRDHIEFAMAFYNLALRRTDDKTEVSREVRSPRNLRRFKRRDVVVREFKGLVAQLGLKWSRYEKYMRNFDDRKEYGELA